MSQIQTREVKVFDAASLTGLAQNFGTALGVPAYKFSLINASNRDIEIEDGTSQDPIYIPAGATFNNGEGYNQVGPALSIQATFPAGTQLTITGVTGAAGTGTIVAYIWS